MTIKHILKINHPSKVGCSIDIEGGRDYSCIDSTGPCEFYCYRLVGHNCYQQNIAFRVKQFKEVKRLLRLGKLEEALIDLLKWEKYCRLHQVGDFFSPEYVEAWVKTLKALPDLIVWAYTRSWKSLGKELSKLAALPNMKLWISCDEENWLAALAFWNKHPEFAGIAFMQSPGAEQISLMLKEQVPMKNLVIFPTHACGSQLRTGTKIVKSVPNCPTLTGKLSHDHPVPACLRCTKCLPKI